MGRRVEHLNHENFLPQLADGGTKRNAVAHLEQSTNLADLES